ESLDELVFSGRQDGGMSYHDRLADEKAASPTDSIKRDLLRKVLGEALSQLDTVSQEIVELSFGLRDGIVRSDKEIAGMLGMEAAKIRGVINRELRRLKMNKRLEESP